MATVCPTILAESAEDYKAQMARVESFAERIQIDLADGTFAPNKTINPIQAWWPDGVTADLHIMHQNPSTELETLISLEPSLVIVHAEAEGDLKSLCRQLSEVKIKTGVALLKDTSAEAAQDLITIVDHVLIFSGDLGHFGGEADLSLASKIEAVKTINPVVEIGWDGGVSANNARQLVDIGVDVLNVGGFIQNAGDPKQAYDELIQAIA